ncbi:DUF6708 domain-containing protein [Pseudorhodoferax sp.]|uniref:DUF6708 domain-containing protein n=1 Tax=Pseudorhodoferax sp. TaxID=1993553 RepID=UPI0039E55CCB
MAQSKKKRRVFSAYGSLDKRARAWQYLGSVGRSTGQRPNGDDLVYRSNGTTLEIGQGLSNLKGMIWLVAAFGTGTVISIFYAIFFIAGIPLLTADAGIATFIFGPVMLILLAAGGFFLAMILINDLFGYTDAPLRFDRASRKVYVWASRKQGPIVLDWDAIKPVAQSVGMPPYQVNRFRSVLLVDEDADGEVRFEGNLPRIAQIGSAVLDRESPLAAYEYCRLFMEHGPQVLPAVKRHLVFRPRGWRNFFDIMGLIGGFMRDYPSRPKEERSLGWMVFGVVIVAPVAFFLWPWQLTQGLAVKFTTRVPKWPQAYEEMAAPGGPMRPPAGSEPNDMPMLPHEKLIAGIWIASAVAVWIWLAWLVWL